MTAHQTPLVLPPRLLAQRVSDRVVSGRCSVADARHVIADLERDGEWELASHVRMAVRSRLGVMRDRGFRSWVAHAMSVFQAVSP